eukprot:1064418_1
MRRFITFIESCVGQHQQTQTSTQRACQQGNFTGLGEAAYANVLLTLDECGEGIGIYLNHPHEIHQQYVRDCCVYSEFHGQRDDLNAKCIEGNELAIFSI